MGRAGTAAWSMATGLTAVDRVTMRSLNAKLTPATSSAAALPEGVSAWNGWANRLVFAAYYLWVILAGRAVLARAAG